MTEPYLAAFAALMLSFSAICLVQAYRLAADAETMIARFRAEPKKGKNHV